MMKKLTTILVLSLFLLPATVFAQARQGEHNQPGGLLRPVLGEEAFTRPEKKPEMQPRQGTTTEERSGWGQGQAKNIDERISHVLELRERIVNSTSIPEEQKAKMLERIDAHLEKLKGIQEGLEKGERPETPSSKELGREAGQAGLVVVLDRALAITTQMELFEEKLATRIADAEANGVDTSSLESLLAGYSKDVATARVLVEGALEELKELNDLDTDTAVELLKNVREDAKEAHLLLSTARQTAGEIAKSLKGS